MDSTKPFMLSKKTDSEPLYRQIGRHFSRQIENREVGQLDILPPASVVARNFNVNYRTARQAYEMLEDLGMISMEGGKAKVIASRPTQVQSQTGTIAVITYNPDISSRTLENFYSSDVFCAISDAVTRIGMTVQRVNMREGGALTRLMEEQWSGIIFSVSSSAHVDGIPMDELKDVPKVFLDPVFPDEYYVCGDHDQGIRLAMQHVYDLGHRDIAIAVGALRDVAMELRLQTYLQCMSEYGLSIEPNWLGIFSGYFLESPHDQETLYKSLFCRGKKPTAIIAAQHFGALGLLNVLHRHNVRVPQDVSMVAYDETPSAMYSIPPLTTIKQCPHQIGNAAVELLSDLINKKTVESQHVPVEIIVRESTAAL